MYAIVRITDTVTYDLWEYRLDIDEIENGVDMIMEIVEYAHNGEFGRRPRILVISIDANGADCNSWVILPEELAEDIKSFASKWISQRVESVK